VLFLLLSILGPAGAADRSDAESAKAKPMNMDQPMASGMKKPGMKIGDVKKAAEKWDRQMRAMLKKEQQPVSRVKK